MIDDVAEQSVHNGNVLQTITFKKRIQQIVHKKK